MKIIRNFEEHKTRHEAFLAYEALSNNKNTPIWIEDDDIPCALVIDFNDWLWLPVKTKQAYKVSQYCEQYLGRKCP